MTSYVLDTTLAIVHEGASNRALGLMTSGLGERSLQLILGFLALRDDT